MTESNVTIVLASIDSSATIERSLRGFADELAGRGRIIVVDASRNRIAATCLGDVQVLNRPSGTLAPVLWRDGLRESTTEFVAFSTAQMVPRRGWFSELMRTIQWSGSAGVGGPMVAVATAVGRDSELPTRAVTWTLRVVLFR